MPRTVKRRISFISTGRGHLPNCVLFFLSLFVSIYEQQIAAKALSKTLRAT